MEHFLHRLAVIPLPTRVVDQRIEMEAHGVAPALAAAGCVQAFLKTRGFQLFFARDAPGVHGPRNDRPSPVFQALEIGHMVRLRLELRTTFEREPKEGTRRREYRVMPSRASESEISPVPIRNIRSGALTTLSRTSSRRSSTLV